MGKNDYPNRWQEEIADIAMNLVEEGKTMTFEALAEELDHQPRLMARRVGSAHSVMWKNGRYQEAEAIAKAFTDKRGRYSY